MSTNNHSLISVVIPLYNKREAITKTLDSVAGQTYRNWECVIVDDSSTDDSVDFVKPFLVDHRFRLIQKENGGVSSARNLGVESAKGDYVIFLDADDFFLPKSIERLVYVREKYHTNIACGRNCSFVRGTLLRHFAPLAERRNYRGQFQRMGERELFPSHRLCPIQAGIKSKKYG